MPLLPTGISALYRQVAPRGNGGEAHTHEAREPAIAAGRERVQCRFGSQRHCSRAATHERTDCSAAGNAAGLVPPA